MKFCQSCGMPLTSDEVCGTNADGSLSADYCTYCYQQGKFAQDCTMDEMIEHCAQFVEEFNKDSEQKVTKEEAIEIATNKEKEFSNLEISDTTADLSIEKMNIFIYCLENNIINENGEIKTDDITRNVWVVDVKHNKETKPKDAEIETVKKLYNKKYYIDATTGEIIGGEQSEYFNN